MHLFWEKSPNSAGDCHIRSLSWMGRVPDEIPQEEGWKLNRSNYYQEGWLSTASLMGIVGVTFTTSHCSASTNGDHNSSPQRTNYNLRGHRSEVTLVRWNEPYQKLASCDSSGIIFVWIKYEGRWSIELINDRSTPVSCFAWSHDGRMALICYQDGFVLVGSVAGQRYWSTLLPQTSFTITCGTWTPDDQHVYLGTSQGGIIVMDIVGNTVGRVFVHEGIPIADLSWNCERFSMEEQSDQTSQEPPTTRINGKPFVLAVSFGNGTIKLMRAYDDVIPQIIETGFQNFVVDWTNNGDILAVAGKVQDIPSRVDHSFRYVNWVKFYTDSGSLIYSVQVPSDRNPVTAMTWGHNDRRLFVATGNHVHVGWVTQNIPSLQLLSRLKVYQTMKKQDHVQLLPLPCRIQNLIGMLFTKTVKSYVPTPGELLDFATKVHINDVRFHCTMIRHLDNQANAAEETNGLTTIDDTYTLFLEHLGGFLPILKGRKTSKIRPEFVIYDPTLPASSHDQWIHLPPNSTAKRGVVPMDVNEIEFVDPDEDVETSQTPRARRRRRPAAAFGRRRPGIRYGLMDNTEYMNVLPENSKLAEITSNFWGTKFQMFSLNLNILPVSLLGEIIYKASLLHLQPRQMRIELPDLLDTMDDFTFDDDSDPDDDNWPNTDLDEFDFDQGVSMRDGILRAVAPHDLPYTDDSSLTAASPSSSASSSNAKPTNIAPIAPLPTRLSFCLPNLNSSTRNTPCSPKQFPSSSNEAQICEALNNVVTNDLEKSSEISVSKNKIKSPVRTVVGQVLAREEGTLSKCSVGSLTPENQASLSPLRLKTPLMESSTTSMTNEHTNYISPSKLRLRMSVSCDNYLGENARFCLSRRDSVGSGSPHSSRGSPRKWAIKAEEVMETEDSEKPASVATNCHQRSGSTNGLDAIVDLLGVPSEILSQRDLNRRLILLKERKKMENDRRDSRAHPSLDAIGKSLSCDDEKRIRRRHRRKRPDIETKRKSIYAQNCRGRTEARACENCESVAKVICDDELNKEIFDISPTKEEEDDGEKSDKSSIAEPLVNAKDGGKASMSDPHESIEVVQNTSHGTGQLPPITENIPATARGQDGVRQKQHVSRKLDSVRSLLEKARSILQVTRSRSRQRQRSKQDDHESVVSLAQNGEIKSRQIMSQSSPNTPRPQRRPKPRARERSFSPVKALLNSPLMRRRNKTPSECHDEAYDQLDSRKEQSQDILTETLAPKADYQDLETFQKQNLKQKLLNMNENRKTAVATANLNPTPAPTPQFLSPFLPRKNFLANSPNLSILGRARGSSKVSSVVTAPPPVKIRTRRKLVLRNKSPMWNEISQVYQLDFGGRVTQESAKNFQIEYKDKQVMQFGRIDSNAYTLDFQYPFTAVQAFGVALANVTQRLK